MVINLKGLLDLYDHKTKNNIGCVSAINAMIGEDLAVALFLDYARGEKLNPSVVSEKVTQGSTKGVRLDRWLSVQESNKVIYYQSEIKNWTAHSYRGKSLPNNLDEEGMKKYRKDRWEQRFDISNKCLRDTSANKVLVPMKLDTTIAPDAEIRPLIIFWEAMHPEGFTEEFFSHPVSGKDFDELWVFSMSNYVRNLIDKDKVTKIEVNMPAVDARIQWLNTVYE
jgi:hypothetical protein